MRYLNDLAWACVVFLMIVPAPVRAQDITVFAASSLQGSLDDIAGAFETQSAEQVTLVYGASSSLARQIARGAPADVVLLADEDWTNWLINQGTLPTAIPFASNRLILIGRDTGPIMDPAHITEAVGDGVLAMAQVDTVPAGRYGKAALMSLGLWQDLSSRVVQAANVRAALRFVDQGEAPLGIGYASDLVALPSLRDVFRFDADSHPAIVYSGGVVTAQGADFMDYINSQPAQDILSAWGFLPPPGDL